MRPGVRVACRRAASRGRRSGSSAGTLLAVLAAADVVDTEDAREELVAAADACDRGTGRFGVANPAADEPGEAARPARSSTGSGW